MEEKKREAGESPEREAMELCLVNFKGDGSNSPEGEISILKG